MPIVPFEVSPPDLPTRGLPGVGEVAPLYGVGYDAGGEEFAEEGPLAGADAGGCICGIWGGPACWLGLPMISFCSLLASSWSRLSRPGSMPILLLRWLHWL